VPSIVDSVPPGRSRVVDRAGRSGVRTGEWEGKTVEYRRLGRSGIQVSVIGLGTNQFGRAVDERTTAEIIHRAMDRGINHIDTADTYTGPVSESHLGKAIADRRDQVVLATKTGFPLHSGVDGQGVSRRRIIQNVDNSLRRLQTDYIDLFYLHRPDPNTPIEESLRALDDLITAGKIRYGACSNYSGWQIAEMAEICDRRGYAAPVVSQSLYNLLEREIEAEVIPACRHYGMSIVPYAPLASGFLTGKYRRGEEVPAGVRGHGNQQWQERRLTDRNFMASEVLESFAQEQGRSVSDLAIAWLLAQPVVCSVIAGVTRPDQVESNAAAGEWKLSQQDLSEIQQRLDEAGV
jgi:aryl-alcohol dehydrogenase-like predicted oxidoreductase